jgi:hypothetical protein
MRRVLRLNQGGNRPPNGLLPGSVSHNTTQARLRLPPGGQVVQISRLGDLNAPSRGLVGLLWALGHGVINPVLDGLAGDFGVAANVCLCRGAKVGLLLVKHVPRGF